MNSNKHGFTLIELLVVIAMIAMVIAALATSYGKAQARARVERARSEVKLASQAILSYENYDSKHELPETGGGEGKDADANTLGFLIGRGGTTAAGDKIPATLQASLQSGGMWRDPWGTPYKIKIVRGNAQIKIESAAGSMQTGLHFPNFYRLSAEERR